MILRDQEASAFTRMLQRFCDASGVVAAALVDADGETVDYAGKLEPFDIKVAAAEWRIVLGLLEDSRVAAWRATRQLYIRGRLKSFSITPLSSSYAIVAVLPRYAFSVSKRALSELIREVYRESGLEPLSSQRTGEVTRWMRVDVKTSADGRRPRSILYEGEWHRVEILGRYHPRELERRERGFRVRLPSGAELTLVREPLDVWYANEL